MVQFHNAPSNFAKLASGETGIGYQSPQPVSEYNVIGKENCFHKIGKENCFHKIGTIMCQKE